jgi:hypothetical protein
LSPGEQINLQGALVNIARHGEAPEPVDQEETTGSGPVFSPLHSHFLPYADAGQTDGLCLFQNPRRFAPRRSRPARSRRKSARRMNGRFSRRKFFLHAFFPLRRLPTECVLSPIPGSRSTRSSMVIWVTTRCTPRAKGSRWICCASRNSSSVLPRMIVPMSCRLNVRLRISAGSVRYRPHILRHRVSRFQGE